MDRRTTTTLVVASGVAGVLLYFYLRYRRYSQRSIDSRPRPTPFADNASAPLRLPKNADQIQMEPHTEQHRPEKSEKDNDKSDTYTCACGLKISEGGCAPGYNPSLLGTVKEYEKHIIICTGTKAEDWDAKIAEPGSFAAIFKDTMTKYKGDIKSRGLKFKLTNSDECTLEEGVSGSGDQTKADLIIFPEKIRYLSVDANHLEYIIQDHLLNDRVSERVKHVSFSPQLILVCCHGNRDSRCGSRGPEAVDGFKKALATRGIGEDLVMVRQSSHLGGHKYAGVVVVYPRGDWYGFVDGAKADELIDKYVQRGQVVPQLWRGRMGIGKKGAKAEAAQVCHDHQN